MKNYIDNYIEFLTYQKKYSQNTIDSYLMDLEKFEKYLEQHKLNYEKLNHKDVTNYLIFLSAEKLSASSINRHLSSIRGFYNFLIQNKIVKCSPFKMITGPRKDKKLPNFLQYYEFEDLISTCDDTPLGIRNRMILELIFATGVRVSEATSIKLKDINFKEREILIHGKGNKERIVFFNKVCQEVMSNYVINSRQEILAGKYSEFLLLNARGENITRRGIQEILSKLIQKSSLKHKITPHTLRHTFATLLLNEGMDIREVQELLGHESLSTTSIYTHVTNEELRKVYLRCHPRAHK